MKSLDDYKKSVIWHVVTGKYEVLPDLTLRKRKESEMKDSASEWIGKIPKEWKEFRIKEKFYLATGTYNSTDADEKGTIPFYRATAENPCALHSKENFDYPSYLILPKDGGSPTNMYGKEVAMGTSFLVNGKASATSHCYAIIPKKGCATWLHLQLSSRKQDINCKAIYTTGLGALGKRTIEEFLIPTPQKNEERLIISFLEKFEASLPNPQPYIDAKKAWKKSLTWHIVTGKYEVLENGKLRKRADKELKTKNGWAVPKDWDVVRLKDIANLIAGGTPSSGVKEYYTDAGDGYDWIQVCDIKGGLIEKTSKQVTDKGKEFTKTLPENSVVLAMYASVGKCGKTTNQTEINQAVLGITPKKPNNRDWIFHTLSMQEALTASLGRGGTQNNTNASICKNICLPWAPEKEKTKITTFLENL